MIGDPNNLRRVLETFELNVTTAGRTRNPTEYAHKMWALEPQTIELLNEVRDFLNHPEQYREPESSKHPFIIRAERQYDARFGPCDSLHEYTVRALVGEIADKMVDSNLVVVTQTESKGIVTVSASVNFRPTVINKVTIPTGGRRVSAFDVDLE